MYIMMMLLIAVANAAIMIGRSSFRDWFNDRLRGVKATPDARENISIGAVVRLNKSIGLVYNNMLPTKRALITNIVDKETDIGEDFDLGACAYPYGGSLQENINSIIGINKDWIEIILFPGYTGEEKPYNQNNRGVYKYHPIGTIVSLKDREDIGMIVSHFIEDEEEGKLWGA